MLGSHLRKHGARFRLGVLFLAVALVGQSQPLPDSLIASDGDAVNWPLTAHGYGGNRYVTSTTLTPPNVRRLRRAWTYKIDDDGMMEASPVVWNGTLFITSAHDNVYALDAKTGAEKWTYRYRPVHAIALQANRGVALHDGKLFIGTLDGHVLALDAETGKVLWDVIGVHDQSNSFYTMAPLPYKNLVLIGASNGDWGGAGYVTAFDARSGKRVWEWQSIPGPRNPGHETWSGDSWKRGGGSVWGGLTLDVGTATLYVDTGNPQPDLVGSVRTGANLYTDSVVALDIGGRAPQMRWFHQFTAHDTHDWDPAMPPVRFAGRVGGVRRELVAVGDKGGTLWILDAVTGELVQHVAVSTQRGADLEPTPEGITSCPGMNGGVQYNGGSYLPETNTFYVPSIDECAVLQSPGPPQYVAGELYVGGTAAITGPRTGWMNAVDVDTGRLVWRRKLAQPALGGALSLSTGVVFSGQLNGEFDAYDARTGTVLWHLPTGSAIKAAPAAFTVDGRQYIAVASGQPGKNFEMPGVPQTPDGSVLSVFAP